MSGAARTALWLASDLPGVPSPHRGVSWAVAGLAAAVTILRQGRALEGWACRERLVDLF